MNEKIVDKRYYTHNRQKCLKRSKVYYDKNKAIVCERDKELYRRNKQLWKEFLRVEILKRGNKCSRCNNSFPQECYDWHHRSSFTKVCGVAEITCDDFNEKNKEKLLVELSKCDLVCSNCHRIIENERKNR